MLRFTPSKDGEPRCTVRTQFRIDVESVVYALAYDAFEIDIPMSWHTYFGDHYTKARIEEIVRQHCYVNGPPPQWPERDTEDDEDWQECLEAARDYVHVLWKRDLRG